MSKAEIIIGQVLSFTTSPFEAPIKEAARIYDAVLVRDGKVEAVGGQAEIRARAPDAVLTDCGQYLISAGFVDAHVHYPQTAIIASWGKRLIDWLESYTFPEEIKCADPGFARRTAERYFDLTLAYGTTTVASFCTSDPTSVDAFFQAAIARGVRAIAGKTCMDRNAPAALCDTPQRAYDESKALIE
ncbi:MAG: amidohydrolase family protein, partial [Pseudomonadota bacterium]